MRKLLLIKHAHVEVAADAAADEWHLSEKGRASCAPLAQELRPHLPFKLVCSEETKAVETAEELSKHLGIAHETRGGLGEHDRSNVPVMPTREFISLVELFFRRPDELVLGKETADEAFDRFHDAIDDLIDENPEGNIAVISHGTVIALLLEEYVDKPGFQLWRQMGLPSLAVIELPAFDVTQIVDRIG